jgi:serine protease Do
VHKQILTTIMALPLMLNLSHAAQRWTVEPSQPYGIPSEDSGTSSYLGVDIADVTSDRVSALKLKEEKGVEVTMVDQDAPAGKAGIKEHDVVISMNGTPVESKSQLQRMIHETPAGRIVTLVLSRDGQPVTIKVQLGDRNKEFAHMGKNKDYFSYHYEVPPIPNVPPVPNIPDIEIPSVGVVVVHSLMRSGVMVENLTPQLGEFFGAKNGGGVLVRSVEKGSRADKAGLRAGDVVTRVGDQNVHDTSDFTNAIHSHRDGGSVSVIVIRDRKEQTITLTLPEHKESGEVIEESMEEPELNADSEIELSQMQQQIAKLQPQVELAKESMRQVAEEMRKSWCDQQKKLKEEARKMKEQMEPQIRQELEKSRQKLQEEMERMRHEMQGEWMDI